MATNHNVTVRRNDEIIANLEDTGQKQPDMPLPARYTVRFTAKFNGKKRHPGNSGKCGRAGRRTKKLYLGTGSGPQWGGPPRTK